MIDVACAPGVLIPRPETEMLVEEVLNNLDTEVLSPEAAARQRVELPWNDEVEEARKAEAALADERATAERRAANLTAADEAALGSDVLVAVPMPRNWPIARPRKPPRKQQKPKPRKPPSPSSTNTASPSRVPSRRRFQLRNAAAPAPAEPRTARVLEVGCGTGCISLSIAWGASRPRHLHCYRYRAARHRPCYQKPRCAWPHVPTRSPSVSRTW